MKNKLLIIIKAIKIYIIYINRKKLFLFYYHEKTKSNFKNSSCW